MQGIIFGDRKLTLAKKSYYLDSKNMIFCEISWGNNKNSQKKDSSLNDYFSGNIVKLRAGTNIRDYKHIKAKDVEKSYG